MMGGYNQKLNRIAKMPFKRNQFGRISLSKFRTSFSSGYMKIMLKEANIMYLHVEVL